MGYVEGLGTGIPRIKNDMRNAHLADPEFTIDDWFFRVTFYNNKGIKKETKSHPDLNERQKKALQYLRKHSLLKASTYADINKVSYPTAINDITKMIDSGHLLKTGTFRGAYYRLA